MTKRKKYLYADNDRHGNQRLYFRPPGCKKVRIKFAAGSKEANAEYELLMRRYMQGDLPTNLRPERSGSLEWLFEQFQRSSEFTSKAQNTQIQRANFYKRIARVHGDIGIAEITGADLAQIRDTLGPGAGRNMLKAVSAAYTWACLPEVGIATANPAKGVTRPSQRTRGYAKWTMDDVLQFKRKYPKGSNPRKCLAMILFTSREISGVRMLGRGDVRDGMIRGYRQKTWVDATTPVLPILKDELGEDYDDLVWLRAAHGDAYSIKSLSQTFSRWATDADLPELSAHGLRKSVATILAELGISQQTIMAVLSHTDARQAQIYIQDAQMKLRAIEGMNAVHAHIAPLWNKS